MELLLVLVILSLIAAIAYPASRGIWREVSGQSAQTELVALLRQARWQAANEGCRYEVSFTPKDNDHQVSVYRRDASAGSVATLVSADWAYAPTSIRLNNLAEDVAADRAAKPLALTIVFGPGGVDGDYLLGVGDDSAAHAIEIRKPGGAVRFVDTSAGDVLTPERLIEVDAWWEANCKQAGD